MKTIYVNLEKTSGFIDNDAFNLLTTLFEKTKPSVLDVTKEDAKKIINKQMSTLTSGSLILYRSNDLIISTYQSVAEIEYYLKKYKLKTTV